MTNSEKTLTVPEAGRIYFGISANAAYAAANRGDIPFIQVGRLKRVPIAAMEAMVAAASRSEPPRAA
jgi:hypothetical protein